MEPLKIHFYYERLQFPSASLSAKNRPQRSYNYACGDF